VGQNFGTRILVSVRQSFGLRILGLMRQNFGNRILVSARQNFGPEFWVRILGRQNFGAEFSFRAIMSDASTSAPAVTSHILTKFVLTNRPVHEYRGVALPALGHFEPQPADGDIYLVTSTPHRVFYYGDTQWHEWDGSMPNTRHPKTSTRFLHPGSKHIIWGHYGSHGATIKNIRKTFPKTATAHDYVAHVLRKEAESDPARLARAQNRSEKRTLDKAVAMSGSTTGPTATTTSKKLKRSGTVNVQNTLG
jgi:hypothetical protein